MRALFSFTVLVAAVAALAACGTSSTSTGPTGVGGELTATTPLSADVFPFRAGQADFALTRGERAQIVVRETGDPDHVVMIFSPPQGSRADGVSGTEMDVRRSATALTFANGPASSVELVRFGIAPGEEWITGTETVRFDGWERINVPAGTYDAARIRWFKGSGDVQLVETWWLAPGVGLVRMESNHGGVFVDSLVRTSR